MSRPTSILVTEKPSASRAFAQASPERSETSRSADRPPMRTAMCLVMLHSNWDRGPDCTKMFHERPVVHVGAHYFLHSSCSHDPPPPGLFPHLGQAWH